MMIDILSNIVQVIMLTTSSNTLLGVDNSEQRVSKLKNSLTSALRECDVFPVKIIWDALSGTF